VDDPETARLLDRAVHVLSTEATALSYVTRLYQTDPTARDGFVRAIECIVKAQESGGKLIICGVGKSGLVGRKTVATFKSLGIASSFLHAAEALHGDLGDVRENDTVLFVTYSGRTPELLSVIPHIPQHVPVMVLTAHLHGSTCALVAARPQSILLPAPIHETEEASFGVCAPTTSTTVAIAIGDMLALAAAECIHHDSASSVFRKNHPGGAIGEKK